MNLHKLKDIENHQGYIEAVFGTLKLCSMFVKQTVCGLKAQDRIHFQCEIRLQIRDNRGKEENSPQLL